MLKSQCRMLFVHGRLELLIHQSSTIHIGNLGAFIMASSCGWWKDPDGKAGHTYSTAVTHELLEDMLTQLIPTVALTRWISKHDVESIDFLAVSDRFGFVLDYGVSTRLLSTGRSPVSR